jgi:hypothetical protein
MRRWPFGRLLLCTVLACVSGLSQEPYEARAARLQPEDIPPLIQKAQDGDLSSQVLLWLAYKGGHGCPRTLPKGFRGCARPLNKGASRASGF